MRVNIIQQAMISDIRSVQHVHAYLYKTHVIKP